MTPFTGAADCRRDAVLTTSPAAMPSPSAGRAPSMTSASPVLTAIADLQILARLPHPVADRERGAHGALRVVLVRDRGSEERHDGVADELLDRAAVAFELVAQVLPVRVEERPHVLGIEVLRPAR